MEPACANTWRRLRGEVLIAAASNSTSKSGSVAFAAIIRMALRWRALDAVMSQGDVVSSAWRRSAVIRCRTPVAKSENPASCTLIPEFNAAFEVAATASRYSFAGATKILPAASSSRAARGRTSRS
ncbi:hypothetical protein C5E08_12665 [Rathayibacter iranicus]|nr:hypothetical protein C5E08_12665 [Rathayibacter iranicus]